MQNTLGLLSQKFGRLTVVSKASASKAGKSRWLCRCDCGIEKIVRGDNLTSGCTKSCGCLNRALVSERRTTHGNSQTPEYKAWKAAEYRCIHPNDARFHDYGGRGIEFRLPNFVEFLAHIGPRPSNKHSLDRIDNNGHYEIGNIRWGTKEIQYLNRRSTRMITYQAQNLCMAEWAKKIGCSSSTIAYRLKLGWSVEATLETATGAKR